MRSVENAECGKCGVYRNALTLTDLFISKHFNAFIQHKKCLEIHPTIIFACCRLQ